MSHIFNSALSQRNIFRQIAGRAAAVREEPHTLTALACSATLAPNYTSKPSSLCSETFEKLTLRQTEERWLLRSSAGF